MLWKQNTACIVKLLSFIKYQSGSEQNWFRQHSSPTCGIQCMCVFDNQDFSNIKKCDLLSTARTPWIHYIFSFIFFKRPSLLKLLIFLYHLPFHLKTFHSIYCPCYFSTLSPIFLLTVTCIYTHLCVPVSVSLSLRVYAYVNVFLNATFLVLYVYCCIHNVNCRYFFLVLNTWY